MIIRTSPNGERWELLRSFTGAGRYLIAVIRSRSTGHIRNVSMQTYESWPEESA